jgi:hypothetical protein
MRPHRICLMRFVLSVTACWICWSLVVNLRSDSRALAQESSPVFRGTWTATAGKAQILRGTWSAQTSPHSPNTARGSWTLLNEASEIALDGTWSAQKSGQGWHGTWAARTRTGQSLSGTWNADLAGFSGKTIEDMLKRTAEKQVAGSWRSGRYQGNWWLKGSASRSGHATSTPSVPPPTPAPSP